MLWKFLYIKLVITRLLPASPPLPPPRPVFPISHSSFTDRNVLQSLKFLIYLSNGVSWGRYYLSPLNPQKSLCQGFWGVPCHWTRENQNLLSVSQRPRLALPNILSQAEQEKLVCQSFKVPVAPDNNPIPMICGLHKKYQDTLQEGGHYEWVAQPLRPSTSPKVLECLFNFDPLFIHQ